MPGTDNRTFKQIVLDVAEQHGVRPERIKSKQRDKQLVRARQRVMYEAFATKRFSASQIGGWLNRDHSTVLYGIWKHAEGNKLPFLTRTRKWSRG